jgi:hypothetical protein
MPITLRLNTVRGRLLGTAGTVTGCRMLWKATPRTRIFIRPAFLPGRFAARSGAALGSATVAMTD